MNIFYGVKTETKQLTNPGEEDLAGSLVAEPGFLWGAANPNVASINLHLEDLSWKILHAFFI